MSDSNENKTYKVRINVFSGRKSSEDNLITCDYLQENIEKIMREVATNLEYSAEIVAIILCNDKFTIDTDANDKLVEDKKLEVLLESENEQEWIEIVFKALNSLVVESVFTITALSDLMTQSLRRRKDETKKAMNLGQ